MPCTPVLTDEKVVAIRIRMARGELPAALARAYFVSRPTIVMAAKGFGTYARIRGTKAAPLVVHRIPAKPPTTCRSGKHSRAPENRTVRVQGRPQCKLCRREREQEERYRKRALRDAAKAMSAIVQWARVA